MPKITNWSPIDNVPTTSGRSDIAWQHDETGEVIVVENASPGRYDVLLKKDRKLFKSRLKFKDTQEKARKWAVEWMKDHTDRTKNQPTGYKRMRANEGR